MTTIAMLVLAGTLAVATPTSIYSGRHFYSVHQLPAQVQQAFLQEAGGGRVDDLRRETLDGRLVYEGEILQGGKATLLQVDSNGQILHRGPTHDAPKVNRPFASVGK